MTDHRISSMLEGFDPRPGLEEIIKSVRDARAGASSLQSSKPIPVDAIAQAAIQPQLLAELDLSHMRIAIFKVRSHAVYEIDLKPNAMKLDQREVGKRIIAKGLGGAHDSNHCEWWRVHPTSTTWGIWIENALEDEKALSYFSKIIPAGLNAAIAGG